ncbi:MAG: fimbrial protein [Bacteroidales bacterium]
MKATVLTVLVILSGLFLFSCTTQNLLEQPVIQTEQESTLTISLQNGLSSKASGQGNQADDNYINTLEFFIFHAEGDRAGVLDTYKKFTTADGITNLQIKATTGKKTIYVIANSHRSDNFAGVITLSEFQKLQASLTDDNTKNFIMTGSVEATLQVTTSITLAISRLAAKIELQSIKTAFAGTPYQGMSLSNVKFFLINVHSSKRLHDGLAATAAILNPKALVATDVNACTMPGMLSEDIAAPIGDAGYTTPHYFYAYENTLDTETPDERYTRLVIQATLNGHTYYYPVNVNQVNYGYDPANKHKGIKRNTEYKINVTIMRPGSTDPDKPVEHGVMTVTLNILDWSATTPAHPDF